MLYAYCFFALRLLLFAVCLLLLALCFMSFPFLLKMELTDVIQTKKLKAKNKKQGAKKQGAKKHVAPVFHSDMHLNSVHVVH